MHRLLLLALLASCAGPIDSGDDGPPTALAGADGKADAPELRVRAAGMTLWVDAAVRIDREGEVAVEVLGRTSRNLTGAFAWVPDDGFGEAALIGPRSFAVRLRAGHELDSILAGLPLFVGLDVASGAHLRYDARIDLAPVLYGFRGHPEVFIEAALAPVFVGGAEPLRYRAIARLGGEDVRVEGAGSPAVSSLGVTRSAIDFAYRDLDGVFAGGARIRFVDDDGHDKTARLGVKVTAIGLTIEDAREAWPAGCADEVADCLAAHAYGPDLPACGSYRAVQQCAAGDLCAVMGARALALASIDLSPALSAGVDAYYDGCPTGGGAWCRFGGLDAYMTPECPAEPPALAAIVDLAGAGRFTDGAVLDRAGLAATPLFAATYSPGGPALWRAIDERLGGGAVEGWWLSQPVPCLDCSDFDDVVVVWYPEAGRAVVVRGGHGFDS